MPKGYAHTIASLQLNLEEAANGKTWLLLPKGFRDSDSGDTYPLPTKMEELQQLLAIPIRAWKQDSGCRYLRRAVKHYRNRKLRQTSALLDTERRQSKIQSAQNNLSSDIKKFKSEARSAIDEVKREAEQAIASLNDLFALARKGIEGQMRAHLAGEKWNQEEITAKAFRDCARLVTQAVKGLGLPSDERDKAKEAILDEVAASLKAQQEALAMAPGSKDPETEH